MSWRNLAEDIAAEFAAGREEQEALRDDLLLAQLNAGHAREALRKREARARVRARKEATWR